MTKDELHLYHEQAFDSFSRHVTKYRPHHPLPLRQAQVYRERSRRYNEGVFQGGAL